MALVPTECVAESGDSFMQTLKKMLIYRKENSFWLCNKKVINFLCAIHWPRTRTQLKRNMQQPPLAPYKIISIAFYKCFSQHVALCQNIKTWWWMATLWTMSLSFTTSIYFLVIFALIRTQHWPEEAVWDASCQIHKIPTLKKKKKNQEEKNQYLQPNGFHAAITKKEKEQKSGYC